MVIIKLSDSDERGDSQARSLSVVLNGFSGNVFVATAKFVCGKEEKV